MGSVGHISHPTLMDGCDTGRRMRILLVEDELKMARALRRGLEEEGYAVDAVPDGEDALHRALTMGDEERHALATSARRRATVRSADDWLSDQVAAASR